MVWSQCLEKNDPSPMVLYGFITYRCLVTMSRITPICRVCNTELNAENWYQSARKGHSYICKKCMRERSQATVEKDRERSIRRWRAMGIRPFNENRGCPLFLGVHVAERVLSHVFKSVERMPFGNPGYDFVCNHDKMIDIKSSCILKHHDGWFFNITCNTIADYFLCIAFDNREDLNPLHAWLLPGSKFNHLTCIEISSNRIHKWDEYVIDTTTILNCCEEMKGVLKNDE